MKKKIAPTERPSSGMYLEKPDASEELLVGICVVGLFLGVIVIPIGIIGIKIYLLGVLGVGVLLWICKQVGRLIIPYL